MSALALALGAALSWGAGDFLGGLTSRRVGTVTVLALSLAAGSVAVTTGVLVSGAEAPGWHAALAAAGAGAAGGLGLAGLYQGMAVGAMGVVAPISAAAALIPFAAGLVEGDRPSALQLAGVAAALSGVVLVSREPGVHGPRRAAGVGLALVAALGFGLYFVLMDAAADDGAGWAVLIARLTATSLAVMAAVVVRAPLRVPRRLAPVLVCVGVFDVVANVAFGLATSRGLVSVVSVLASLYPVVTIGLARLVVGERLGTGQRVGAAAALAGAALITAG